MSNMAPIVAAIDAFPNHLGAYPKHRLDAEGVGEKANDRRLGFWLAQDDQAKRCDQERTNRPASIGEYSCALASENQKSQQRHRSAVDQATDTMTKRLMRERSANRDHRAHSHERGNIIFGAFSAHACGSIALEKLVK
jgi:hypothetical protein